jgi:hypothetical protein
MKNADLFTASLTDIYSGMLACEIQTRNPEIVLAKGQVLYDEENEKYVYAGFTDYELKIIHEAESKLLMHLQINAAA